MAGTIVANTINTDTGVYNTNNALNGCAKAWVSFSYVSSLTTYNSFNISSVTRTSTGLFTVNLATALTTTNAAIVASAGQNSAAGFTYLTTAAPASNGSATVSPTTTAFVLNTGNSSYGSADPAYAAAVVFCN